MAPVYTEASIPGTPGYVDNTGLIKGNAKQATSQGTYDQYGNWVANAGYNPPRTDTYFNEAQSSIPPGLGQFISSAPATLSGLTKTTPSTPTGNGQPFAVGDTSAQWIPQAGFYSTDPQLMGFSTQDTAAAGAQTAAQQAAQTAQNASNERVWSAQVQGQEAPKSMAGAGGVKLGNMVYNGVQPLPSSFYTPGFTPTAAQAQQYGATPYVPPTNSTGTGTGSTSGTGTGTGTGTGLGGLSLSGALPFGTFNGVDPQMLQQQIAKDQSSVAAQAGANSRSLANQYASGGFSTNGPGFAAQTALDAARQAMANESIASTDRLNAMNYNAQGTLANNNANYGYYNNLQQNANTRYGIDQNSSLGALGAVLGLLK